MPEIPNPMQQRPNGGAWPTVAMPAMAGAAAPAAPKRRRAWLWVLGILAVLILLSSCVQSLTGQGERTGLIAQNEEMSDALDEALAAEEEAVAAQERAEETSSELEAELALVAPGLEEAEAAVLAMTDERDTALATITELEARIASLEADLVTARSAGSQPAPAAAAPSAARPAPAAAVPSTSGRGSVYYANCSAARAAGAAPVYRGEPGYRSALDRDGDGVGCE